MMTMGLNGGLYLYYFLFAVRLESRVRNELEPLVSQPNAKKANNVKQIPRLVSEMMNKLGVSCQSEHIEKQVDTLRLLQMTFNGAIAALASGPQAASADDPLDLKFFDRCITELRKVEAQIKVVKAEVARIEAAKNAPPPGSDSMQWLIHRKPMSSTSQPPVP